MSLTQQEVTQALVGFIQRRYVQTAGLPLPDAQHPAPRFMAVERRLLVFCLRYREQVLSVLRCDLATSIAGEPGPLKRALAATTTRYIARRNQFVVLSSDDRLCMDALYDEFLASLVAALELLPADTSATERISRLYGLALRRHYQQLRAFFGALDQRDVLARMTLCAEYTPVLQLQVLGLDPAALQEPILDVGCGASAVLVAHLRSLGLDAYGLDRDVIEGPHTARSDWLAFDYGHARWGTILSHMAFSTHLIYQHLNAHGSPEKHVAALMRMLGALAPGGVLAYAPGLPFVETLFQDHGYRLASIALPDDPDHPLPSWNRYAHLLSGDPCYATQIRR